MKTMHWVFCPLAFALMMTPVVAAADAGLVAWWNFDEGPGPTVADASGNGNTGTLHGGVQWVAQQTGGALEFDGASGYVTVPFSESLRVMNRGSGFTLTAWVKPDAIPTEYRVVFQQGDLNGTGRTWLLVHQVNEFRCSLGGTATQSGFAIAGGTWYHAAVVVTEQGSTDTVQIYANGRPAGAATTRNVEDSEGVFYLGCHKNLTNFWAGLIDDVRIYNRPLSPAEIKAMVPPQLKAQKPDPADGDVAVVTPLLRWTPGETALLHDVYFGTDPNLGPQNRVQTRLPVTLYFHVPGLTPGATYWWRVDEIEADMTTVHTGDVWTFTAQALTAYLPAPANGTNDASTDPNMTLAWLPGMNALKHHVYFGDSLDAVSAGTPETDKGTVTNATFTPGPLEPLMRYYWRVDEVGPGDAVTPGAVWSFTTCLLVDDFESYTDGEGSRIYETWVDGWTNGTGSTVGYVQAPFAERRIVHSGKQSMPLDYNNVNSPWYSEAEREWPTPQDWTAEGADALTLFVRGNAANALGLLYVVLEDSSKKTAVVTHTNPEVVRAGAWTEWKVPLSSFADVNLAKVKKMYIGVGDRKTPVAGGAGRIYVDDIRVTKP